MTENCLPEQLNLLWSVSATAVAANDDVEYLVCNRPLFTSFLFLLCPLQINLQLFHFNDWLWRCRSSGDAARMGAGPLLRLCLVILPALPARAVAELELEAVLIEVGLWMLHQNLLTRSVPGPADL